MVDLTHIEMATDEDKAWKIDYWARLFTATTWEDVKMIAEKDSADELIEQRCRARDDFRKMENSRNKIMKELTDALEAKDKEIEQLKQQLAEALSKH